MTGLLIIGRGGPFQRRRRSALASGGTIRTGRLMARYQQTPVGHRSLRPSLTLARSNGQSFLQSPH